MEIVKIKRAAISVFVKDGLEDFARFLVDAGIEIISTGGTAKFLMQKGIPVTQVSDVTGFPEIMDGRLKTLHPGILGGILANREIAAHMDSIKEHGIEQIDLVVVNLYPFEEVASRKDSTLGEVTEMIDIGGPTMLRAAAKNWDSVAVVTEVEDYGVVMDDIREHGGVRRETRQRLAQTVFARTAMYDSIISVTLAERFELLPPERPVVEDGPEFFMPAFVRKAQLRYGENPHQAGWMYVDAMPHPNTVATATQLSGKELSFINIGDMDAALSLAQEFVEPTAVIVKHMTPCGVAGAEDLCEAFRLAREADPVSAFGGIIAVNEQVDLATAKEIVAPNSFYDAIVAPGYDPDALELIQGRKGWGQNIRILELNDATNGDDTEPRFDMRRVRGGLLLQEWDRIKEDPTHWKVATKRAPTVEELRTLFFAWRVCKFVRSNSIVLAKDMQTVGIGGGQVNRVNCVKLAVEQAGEKAKGAVMASDAYFPFPDGPEIAMRAGVTAIAHPGGSKKDQDTFDLADQLGVAVVLTGIRHFKH